MTLEAQLGLVTALYLFSGCGNMPSYESLFDPSPEAIGTGIAGVGLVRAVMIIAKYQATERQRQVAQQNARRAYQRIVVRQEPNEGLSRPEAVVAHKVSQPTREKLTGTGESVASAADRPKQAATSTPSPGAHRLPLAVKRLKMARYLAVDTVPDARSKGEKSVMIWDTATQEIVGNEVYDVEVPPPVMTKASFETHTAQYVDGGDVQSVEKNNSAAKPLSREVRAHPQN